MYQDRKIGAIRELTGDEIALVNGGDGETMWVVDIWYVHGEETRVWIEMKHADDGGWFWTGNWKPTGGLEPKTVEARSAAHPPPGLTTL